MSADRYDEFEADLDAWAEGEDVEHEALDEALEPPRDADRANRMLGARARIVRQLAELDDFVTRRRHELDAWHADRTSGLHRRLASIDRALEGWMRALNRENPKRKTETLPRGQLRLRAPGAGRTEVLDDEALVAWLEANRPDLLKVEPRAKLGEVKAAFRLGPVQSETDAERWHTLVTDEGDPVPGVVIVQSVDDTFSVK